MNWIKLPALATLTMALFVSPATAYADCSDDGQPACTGPVPTVDQVMDLMNEVADPNIPAVNKNDVVTPPFDDDQAQRYDELMGMLRSDGSLPASFTVSDIQSAPNNFAGATVSNPPTWHQKGGATPVVLVLQNGRWMITHTPVLNTMKELIRNKRSPHGL
jgi:hypothetical protein